MPMTILGNTPCELLGGYQERKPGGVVRKLEVLTPRGVENFLTFLELLQVRLLQVRPVPESKLLGIDRGSGGPGRPGPLEYLYGGHPC